MSERPLDPEPWRRCRCVSNLFEPDPLNGRCPLEATAEDGLCDHCRPEACPVGHADWCCHRADVATTLLDRPDEPCLVPQDGAVAYVRGDTAEVGR